MIGTGTKVVIGAGIATGIGAVIYFATKARAAPGIASFDGVVVEAASDYPIVGEGNPISGATVFVTRYYGYAPPEDIPVDTITDHEGYFSFMDVPSGSYEITIIKTGYEVATVSFTLAPDEERSLPVLLEPTIPGLANLTVRATDADTGYSIRGAMVILDALSRATAVNGECVFTDLEPRSYSGLVSKEGYETTPIDVTLHEGENYIEIHMIPAIVPTANVTFTVLDADTLAPLTGIVATLRETVRTTLNGLCRFEGITEGDYPITFVDPIGEYDDITAIVRFHP